MHYVYILKNSTGQLYYGYTNNLERRIAEHNKQNQNQEWKLIYYEAYLAEVDARRREIKLKHYGQSINHIKNRIQHSLSL